MRPTRAAAGKSQSRSTGDPKNRLSFHARREDLLGLLRLLWRQGIVANYRRQFWRQLLGIYRQNPSRMTKYLAQCAMGENLFQIRDSLLKKMGRFGSDKMAPT
jgi:hypothetical protein